MMHVLDHTHWFPEADTADHNGIVALGGDLSPPLKPSQFLLL